MYKSAFTAMLAVSTFAQATSFASSADTRSADAQAVIRKMMASYEKSSTGNIQLEGSTEAGRKCTFQVMGLNEAKNTQYNIVLMGLDVPARDDQEDPISLGFNLDSGSDVNIVTNTEASVQMKMVDKHLRNGLLLSPSAHFEYGYQYEYSIKQNISFTLDNGAIRSVTLKSNKTSSTCIF